MTGMPRPLELFEHDYHQFWIGLQTGRWLAQVRPSEVSIAAGSGDDRTVVLDVRQGKLKAIMRVDRGTWLATEIRHSGVSGLEIWTFSDYRQDLGWKIPGRIRVTRQGSRDETYLVRSMTRVKSGLAEAYDPVRSRPEDAQFDPTAVPRLEAKRAATGHFLVHPRINGLDLGWLIFDTGAGSSVVLDPSAVARLKLTPLGARSITSMVGTTRCAILRGDTLEIGPLTMKQPYFLEMDLSFVRQAMGPEVVGIIGYDLLSRCIAEINVADGSFNVYDPVRFRLNSAPWQKLTLNQALPLVEATLEGERKGLFRIDVGAAGAAGTVVFHAPAVEDLQLLKDRTVVPAKIGPTRVAFGKIAWFELAGHRFKNPSVIFALDRQGPLGDEYMEGNLGVEFLKPFRLILDYPHERMALIPLLPEER
jgi:hypothetical protein